jgi:hypothetical protein
VQAPKTAVDTPDMNHRSVERFRRNPEQAFPGFDQDSELAIAGSFRTIGCRRHQFEPVLFE